MKHPVGLRRLVTLALWAACTTLNAETVSLTQGSTELRAELELASGKTLKDGVVVLLHGTLAHNQMEIMQSVAGLLKDGGYNTLNINLSYGLDKRPSQMLDCAIEHSHRHEDALTELGAWTDWLASQGATKIALLGHSRGGNQVAWFAAEQAPALVEKVVLVAPATWDAAANAANYAERYQQDLAPLLATAQQQVDAGQGQQVSDLPGFVYCAKAKASAAALLSYYKDEPRKNTPTLLSRLKQPTLLVMGSADTVVSDLPAQLKDFKQANVQLATVDGADHFFLDLYADELVEKTIEFLAW